MKPPPRPRLKKAEKVGSLLKQVLGNQGLTDQLSRYQAWLVWDQLVGEQIARRARPLRLRQSVLEVQVDHPVWMQQLQMLKPKILEKINQQIPNAGITDIYLRKSNAPSKVSKHQPQEVEQPLKWKTIELSTTEKQQIEAEISDLNNPELRDEMRRIFTLQKQLDKGRNS
jgi:predicted nucleic acid-binding Zn ribbon protein